MIAHTTVRVGEGIAGKVAQTGEAVLVDNVERDPRFGKPNDPKYATASFICLPVRAHGRVIGVLNLSKKGERRGFSETDMKFLSTLLGYIGFAVDHARLVQEATTSARQLQQVIHEKSSLLSHAQQQLQHVATSPASPPLLAQVGYTLRGPLTAAMAHARLLVKKTETEGAIKTHQMAKYVLADIRRATHTVRNLLAFAEPVSLDLCPENLNEIVAKVLEVKAHNLALGHIDVETDLAPALPPILGDAGQLHQAFLHMVNNARQAMAHQMTPRCLSVRTFQEGTALRVTMADTGPGIAPEYLPQIFTPFFSADTPGTGLGLGLSIAHAIVTAHQGTIAVESHVGEGATFMVDLPIATSLLPQEASAEVPDAEP
jgi:signal transduction histidine kinase